MGHIERIRRHRLSKSRRTVIEQLEDRRLLNGDPTPPSVIGLKVGASQWASAFVEQIDPSGVGYEIPHGSDQLKPLPWSGIQQIFVEFSEDVGNVSIDDVDLRGLASGVRSVQSVNYSVADKTAMIVLSVPLGRDRWQLTVTDNVTDASGNQLDGEWVDGITIGNSGDALPGGDYSFAFNVVPGDGDQTGNDSLNDLQILASNYTKPIEERSIFADFDASGTMTLNDLQILASNWSRSLPPGLEASLRTDTGDSAEDGLTSDPIVVGNVFDESPVTLFAQVNDGATIPVEFDEDGDFTFDPLFESDGAYEVRFMATDSNGDTSITQVSLTVDTVAPTAKPTVELDPEFDIEPGTSSVADDNLVRLMGTTLPDTEIKLLQNGHVVTSDESGEFTFYGVPLMLGPNELTVEVQVLDAAGNGARSTADVMRVPRAGEILLVESSQLVNEQSEPVELGQEDGTRTIAFEIDARFDTEDQSPAATEDILAVYLVDPSNPAETLLDRGVNGTALFTLSGDEAEYPPGIVNFNGTEVQIDATSLGELSEALLLFQLINSDTDLGTQIAIGPVRSTVDTGGIVAATIAGNADPQATTGMALDLSLLSPNEDLTLDVANVRVDSTGGTYTAEFSVVNNGDATGQQVAVVFEELPVGVELLNQSGVDGSGNPYINFQDAILPGGLMVGQSSIPIELIFDDPTLTRFSLLPNILAGSANSAPIINPIGTLEVMPGETLIQAFSASDLDGDPITFIPDNSISQLPSGELSSDGILRVVPRPDQLGSYPVTIIASDGMAQSTLDFTLNVLEDPITTTRVSGVIENTEQMPLVGINVELNGITAMTGADGSFELTLPGTPDSEDTLFIHGQTFVGAEVYPFIAERLKLLLEHEPFGSVNNRVVRPIYLPALDVENGVEIDPMVATMVTTPAIPGTELEVAAGTLLTQENELFTGEVTITEVVPERTPAALPSNLRPSLVVTVQPGELVFGQPAPLSLPNLDEDPPGTVLDLYSINPATGDFDIVGQGQVSVDGTTVETIDGGIRNSSWHFFSSPPAAPMSTNPNNPDNGCLHCSANSNSTGANGFSSTVEFHSGAVIEMHELPTYSSLGQDRGVTLVYDSLRADPRHIVHVGYEDVPAFVGPFRLVAEMEVSRGDFQQQAPGFEGGAFGFDGGENFWTLPEDGGTIQAAVQVDLSNQPSGKYDYLMSSGLLRLRNNLATGSMATSVGDIININLIDSPFGAGWSIAGLQEIVENPDGSALIIDGDGTQLLFDPLLETFAESRFDIDIEGWQTVGDSQTPTHVSSGGNPGGYASADDQVDSVTWRWEAPEHFLGNLSTVLGGTLSFDLRQSRTDNPFVSDDVTIIGNGVELDYRFANPPLTEWTSYTVPIAGDSGWINAATGVEATLAEIQLVLTNVEQLLIRGEFRSGADTGGLDNVVLSRPAQLDGTRLFDSPLADYSELIQAPDGLFTRTLKDQTTYRFDSANRLQDVTDRNGNRTTYAYNGEGKLESMTDPVGLITSFGYTGDKVTSIIDPANRQTRLTYDAAGNLERVVDADGTIRTWGYDDLHHMTEEIDKRGNREQTFYDFAGRATKAIRKDGSVIQVSPLQTQALYPASLTADPMNPPAANVVTASEATYVDGNGNVTTYVLDRAGQIVTARDEVGPLPGFSRDEELLVRTTRDGRGFETQYDYDARGNLILIDDDRNVEGTGVEIVETGWGLTDSIAVSGLESAALNPVDGLIYATRRGSAEGLYRINLDDSLTRIVGGNNPAAVLFDPNDGDAFVSEDFGGVIYRTGLGESSRQAWVQNFHSGDDDPFGMAIAPDDYVGDVLGPGEALVVDRGVNGADEVWRFSMDTPGGEQAVHSDNGTLVDPVDITVTDESVFLVDAGPSPGVVYQLDAAGGLTALGTSEPFPRPVGIAYDPLTSDLVVLDSVDDRVVRIDPDTGVVTELFNNLGLSANNRAGIDITPDGLRIIVSAKAEDKVFVFTRGAGAGGIRSFDYDPTFNQVTSATNELGRQTLYQIDPDNGNTLSVTRVMGELDSPSNGESNDLVTAFAYTTQGQVDTSTDPRGIVTDYDYNALGRLELVTFAIGTADEASQQFEYDLAGNQTAFIDEEGNRTEYSYDALNRLEMVTEADPDGAAGPLESPITKFEHDEAGNAILKVDARLTETSKVYDAMNRPIESIDHLNQVARFAYDKNGNVRFIFDPRGAAAETEYDARQRPSKTIDALGAVTRFGYDLDDNVTLLIDPMHGRSTFRYDARNQLDLEIDQRGKATDYEYDRVGNVVSKVDRNRRVTEFLYDDNQRLVLEKWIENDVEIDGIDYSYDSNDNLVFIRSSLSTIEFEYDNRNQVTSETNRGANGAPDVAIMYARDGAGNVTSVNDVVNGRAGATTSYEYDGLNRVRRILQSGSVEAVQAKQVDFSYNELGEYESIARFSDFASGTPAVSTAFQYDAQNRLDVMAHASGDTELSFFRYDYDVAGRIAAIEDVDGVSTYEHDDRGQLLAVDRQSEDARGNENYAYDLRGNRVSSHLHEAYEFGASNRLISDGDFTYAYDEEGNLIMRQDITSGDYTQYDWDHHNRLVRAAAFSASPSTLQSEVIFTYDPLGRRISKTIVGIDNSAVSTYFVHDRDDVIMDWEDREDQSEPLATRYLHGADVDQVLALETPLGETFWHVGDHLGSVSDIFRQDGIRMAHYRYDSFGNHIGEPETITTFRFTGREYDTELGLQYHRARYLDPAIGRFIGEDQIRQLDSNQYSYVKNRPLDFIDPSGRDGVGLGYTIDQIGTCIAIATQSCGSDVEIPYWAQYLIDPYNPYGIPLGCSRLLVNKGCGAKELFVCLQFRFGDNIPRLPSSSIRTTMPPTSQGGSGLTGMGRDNVAPIGGGASGGSGSFTQGAGGQVFTLPNN